MYTSDSFPWSSRSWITAESRSQSPFFRFLVQFQSLKRFSYCDLLESGQQPYLLLVQYRHLIAYDAEKLCCAFMISTTPSLPNSFLRPSSQSFFNVGLCASQSSSVGFLTPWADILSRSGGEIGFFEIRQSIGIFFCLEGMALLSGQLARQAAYDISMQLKIDWRRIDDMLRVDWPNAKICAKTVRLLRFWKRVLDAACPGKVSHTTRICCT